MEYTDLMKQAEDHNKKMLTKEVNVCDLLTYQDREAIAKIIDQRMLKEYPTEATFKWVFDCKGHFII